MDFKIKKASLAAAKVRVAIDGPAGAGKTLGALKLARGIAGPKGRIVVLDTERGRSQHYAGGELGRELGAFDVLELEAPVPPSTYRAALAHVFGLGYDVVIADSISHEWAGTLAAVDQRKQHAKNQFAAWQGPSEDHERFVQALVQAPTHLIVTMRTKMAYELVKDEKTGREKPVKLGLAPVQREGVEYDLDVVLEVDQETHQARVGLCKTAWGPALAREIDRAPFLSVELGQKIVEWAGMGDRPIGPTPPAPKPTSGPAPVTLSEKDVRDLDPEGVFGETTNDDDQPRTSPESREKPAASREDSKPTSAEGNANGVCGSSESRADKTPSAAPPASASRAPSSPASSVASRPVTDGGAPPAASPSVTKDPTAPATGSTARPAATATRSTEAPGRSTGPAPILTVEDVVARGFSAENAIGVLKGKLDDLIPDGVCSGLLKYLAEAHGQPAVTVAWSESGGSWRSSKDGKQRLPLTYGQIRSVISKLPALDKGGTIGEMAADLDKEMAKPDPSGASETSPSAGRFPDGNSKEWFAKKIAEERDHEITAGSPDTTPGAAAPGAGSDATTGEVPVPGTPTGPNGESRSESASKLTGAGPSGNSSGNAASSSASETATAPTTDSGKKPGKKSRSSEGRSGSSEPAGKGSGPPSSVCAFCGKNNARTQIMGADGKVVRAHQRCIPAKESDAALGRDRDDDPEACKAVAEALANLSGVPINQDDPRQGF